MRNETRMSLNVERDLVWGNWPEDEPEEDFWEEEGLTVTEGGPNQVVME